MVMLLVFFSQFAFAVSDPQLRLAPIIPLADQDRQLVQDVALGEARHKPVELTFDQFARFLPAWKMPMADKLNESLNDLGNDAAQLAEKLTKPLTPETALQYIVITKTYEANAVKYEFDPMTDQKREAIDKIKALTPLLEKSASLRQ
jgi:hypothetical protein